jgi:hypothetical protein
MNQSITNTFLSQSKNASIESFLPTNTKEVNEEQLFIATVSQQLQKKTDGANLVKTFQAHVTKIVQDGKTAKKHIQLEDAGQQAMQLMIQQKQIKKEDADKIIKTAWTAAQLDDNPALWDSISGKNDPTKAVASKEAAMTSSQKRLDAIDQGKLALIDPKQTSAGSVKGAHSRSSNISGSAPQGFLWKPVANSSGTASVLFDSSIGKEAESVVIQDANGNTIDKGRFTSFGDDGSRAKYVFSKAGKEYPADSVVVITLRSGEQIKVSVSDPAKRLEKSSISNTNK